MPLCTMLRRYRPTRSAISLCLFLCRKLPPENPDFAFMFEDVAHSIRNGETPSFSNIKKLPDPTVFTVGNFAMLFHIRPKFVEVICGLLFGAEKKQHFYRKVQRINSILLDCQKNRKLQHYCKEEVQKWKQMSAYPKMPPRPKRKTECKCCLHNQRSPPPFSLLQLL